MKNLSFFLALSLLIFTPYLADAQTANLVVDKSTTALEVIPGGTITYVIEVRNTGTATSTNVVLEDTLNSNLTLAGNTPDASVTINTSGQTVLSFPLGDLAPGATATATIDARVHSQLRPGTILSNTATVEADSGSTTGEGSSAVTVNVSAETDASGEVAGAVDQDGVGGADEPDPDTLPRTGLAFWAVLLPALGLAFAGNRWKN